MLGFGKRRGDARDSRDEPDDAFVALGFGAFQVYDAETSRINSAVVSAITAKDVRVIAADWRGVQFWVEARVAVDDDDAMVSMFDPSTMVSDTVIEQKPFVEAIISGSVVAGVDAEGLRAWLDERELESLPPNTCVPVYPQQFITGSEGRELLSPESYSTPDWLIFCAKSLAVMNTLGLRSGEPLPPDFHDRVAAL
ncbi:hypothetical protein [Tsukamurella paurometabola]|uniref:Uncharacterized protein n=1 Tax=Tsukamurella paurometabola TaxID=2061 RepID=A0ABS5NJ43_TSUPA|nr:hypothetical protein [Tsukamurella paurometabola]MBS4104324.1 hypothetical protein [Tsukamurella paurometabola]